MRGVRIFGYLTAILGAVWQSGKFIVDWLARFDFLASHWAELGWMSGITDFLVTPPFWLPWAVLFFGLALIWVTTKYPTVLEKIIPIFRFGRKTNEAQQKPAQHFSVMKGDTPVRKSRKNLSYAGFRGPSNKRGKVSFDFSTYNGAIVIGRSNFQFVLSFSGRSSHFDIV